MTEVKIVDLDEFHIRDAPKDAYYIPNFISEEEEELLFSKLYAAPKPKWITLSNRRLQNWGGLPHPKGMVAETIPTWLKKHMKSIDNLQLFDEKESNHILVNEYLPGQGIMPHEDGPLFFPTISTISIGSDLLLDFYLPFEEDISSSPQIDISMSNINDSSGSDTNNSVGFHYKKTGSLLLERRSLLVLRNDLYTRYLHGITETAEDVLDESVFNISSTNYSVGDIIKRTTRISLTIRHLPKVLKTKLFFSKIR